MQRWIVKMVVTDAGKSDGQEGWQHLSIEEMKDAVMCLGDAPAGVKLSELVLSLDKSEHKRG